MGMQSMARFLSAAFAGLMAVLASAQSDGVLTHYYEVPTYYNPAAVGETDFLKIRAGSRLQWVGIENAPKTFLATADMPIKLFGKKVGIGAVIRQESIGLYDGLAAGLQAGYKFKALKGELTFALQLGMVNEAFRGTEVYIPDDDDYHQSTDDGIPTTDLSGTSLDLGLGLWYTHKLFYAGLSCTHINSPSVKLSMEGSESTESQSYEFNMGRTVYFMAGSNIPIKNTLFEVIPSVLIKSDFTFTQAEVTARLRYNKFLIGGVGYRYNDAVSLILGAEFRNFYIGYSYDYPTSAISQASSGSHEIFAGYQMKLDLSDKNRHRHKSIRIM
jgi:type IX secretion system PorP/SprF family membrane protein